MSNQTEIVSKVFNEALSNQSQAEKFVGNPADAFREAGLNLPESVTDQFNSFLERVAGTELNNVKQVSRGGMSSAADLSVNDFNCTACKIYWYGTAVEIAGLSAADRADLSIDDPVVDEIAAAARVSTSAALVFIKGLGTAIADGADIVVTRVCEFTHDCRQAPRKGSKSYRGQ